MKVAATKKPLEEGLSFWGRLGQVEGTVVVAVAVVGVVQMAVHQIVHMVAVGHGRVAAAGAVHMVGGVAAAFVAVAAAVRIAGRHLNAVLVHVVAVGVVQMAIVQIVQMAVVFHRRVATAGAVDMVMVGVLLA